MRRTRQTALAVHLIAVVLTCGRGLAALAIPLDEDVDFGCALAKRGFPVLAVDILKKRFPEVKAGAQKQRIYGALYAAHASLAQLARDDADRAKHQAAADKWHKLIVAGARDREGFVRIAQQASQGQNRIAGATSDAARQQAIQAMTDTFEAALKGLTELHQQATRAIEEHIATELPDPAKQDLRRAWLKKERTLSERDLGAGIDLNRVRYWYSKALPKSEAARKKQLLEEAVEGLEDYCAKYANWVYTIVGNEMLARAAMDLGRHDEAVAASEAGIELIMDYLRQNAGAKDSMRPWHDRLMASRVLATARAGGLDRAIVVGRAGGAPKVQLALAEVYLMKAEERRQKNRSAEAKAYTTRAGQVIEQLKALGGQWRAEAEALEKRHDPKGASSSALFQQFREAARARNNPGVIKIGIQLLAFGKALPGDRRVGVVKALAVAYLREKMFYEAHVVYAHLATTTGDEKAAETAAKRAVECLRRQHELSKDSADRALFDAAGKWRRDNFRGPGIEYERAIESKKQKRYEAAISQFKLVKKESLYYEAALEQIGECYVLLAKAAGQTEPERVDAYLKLGRTALLTFLEKARRPVPLPRVIQMRKTYRAAATYRLAAISMWKGREDYKACIALTEDFVKRFPTAPRFHPYALVLRVEALVATGRLAEAQADLLALQHVCAAMKDKKKAGEIGSRAINLLVNAQIQTAGTARKNASAKDAQAAQAADPKKADALRKEAAALRAKATDHANKALGVLMPAINANPNLPYAQIYYVIVELRRQGRFNELSLYLKIYLDRFDGDKDLTAAQTREVADASIMLAEAYVMSGQHQKAYDTSAGRLKALEAIQRKTGKTPPQIWTVRKWIAKSALHLAKGGGAEAKTHATEALDTYLKLRGVLKRGTDDWWDVTVGALEAQNVLDMHRENVLSVKRLLMTRPDLGGAAHRERVVAVLAEIVRELTGKAPGPDALQLLVDIRLADLKALREAKGLDGILARIESVRKVAADCGGPENREKLISFATFALENTKDEGIAKRAAALLKKLRN